MTLESTATLVDPDVTLADLTEAALPELKQIVIPSPSGLAQAWAGNRLDWLALALELPETLPQLDDMLVERLARSVPSEAPRERSWPVALAFAVGAAAALAMRTRTKRNGGSS